MRLATLLVALVAASALALAQAPNDAAQNMVGTWELSNSERDKLCNLTFKTDPAKGGFKVEFDAACVGSIPALKGIEAWTLNNETLRLLDGRGRAVFEMSEVEIGIFEGERKDEGLYFLQTAESAAVFTPKRSVEQMTGEWSMTKLEKPVCDLTLTDRPTKGFDEFVLSLKSPCDPAMTRLNPNVWRLDRGELVLVSPNGQVWRFEESEPSKWRRVPEGAEAIGLLKK